MSVSIIRKDLYMDKYMHEKNAERRNHLTFLYRSAILYIVVRYIEVLNEVVYGSSY